MNRKEGKRIGKLKEGRGKGRVDWKQKGGKGIYDDIILLRRKRQIKDRHPKPSCNHKCISKLKCNYSFITNFLINININ